MPHSSRDKVDHGWITHTSRPANSALKAHAAISSLGVLCVQYWYCVVVVRLRGCFFLLLAQTTKNRVFQHNKSASWREGDSHVQQALSTEAETPAAAVAVDMFCFGDLSLGERSIGCACSVSATSKDRSVVLAAVFRPLICWKQM